jgi:hypothetical protein
MEMTVTLPYDPVWAPLSWAKEHCPSYITNDVNKPLSDARIKIHIDYFFASERDAVFFSLRWL